MTPVIHISILLFLSCTICPKVRMNQEEPHLVGACEGCEAILEFGYHPLSPVDTLPDFYDPGKKIVVTGTVYEQDGLTPASGVILYIYHTDQEGRYVNRYHRQNWERRHGYIRGWVRTGNDGRYAFYTLRPGTYPDGSEPAHIHITLLEPGGSYYWLGSYHFKGDPLLTDREAFPEFPRGGSSGLLELTRQGDLWTGQRDIVLGLNVPGYK